MRLITVFISIVTATFLFACSSNKAVVISDNSAADDSDGKADIVRSSLDHLGVERSDINAISDDVGLSGGLYPEILGFNSVFLLSPLKTPEYLESISDHISGWEDMSVGIRFATRRLDQTVRFGQGKLPAMENQNSLQVNLDALASSLSDSYCFSKSGRRINLDQDNWQKYLSDEWQSVINELLAGLTGVQNWRSAAFARIDQSELFNMDLPSLPDIANTRFHVLANYFNKINYRPLYRGALQTSAAIEMAIGNMSGLPSFNGYLHWKTNLGDIVIFGSDDESRQKIELPGNYFLIINTSGSYTYEITPVSEIRDGLKFIPPVQVMIDVSGDDVYLAGKDPSFGGSYLNYNFLVDLSGDDIYNNATGFWSFGSGLFGVGVLWDLSGDDKFDSELSGLGLGCGGIGMLMDDSGNDSYKSYFLSQGAGLSYGFGMLLDHDGNDYYELNDSRIIFPSSQTPDHQLSMGQGCGIGFRRDAVQEKWDVEKDAAEFYGVSLPGGVGMLWDGAGDDIYSAGVFAQGAGFWGGGGYLMDAAGNDKYNAVWYAQGSSAHYSVGSLLDLDGDDTYTGLMTMCAGAANDFSAGVHYDAAGKDQYSAQGNSLGAGYNNGIGIFINRKGDDTYKFDSGRGLGQAWVTYDKGYRTHNLTVGLFWDLAGLDNYVDMQKTRKNLRNGMTSFERRFKDKDDQIIDNCLSGTVDVEAENAPIWR